jgi:hypothetical protein
VGGWTCPKSSALDTSFVLNGGNDFELAFGELMDFNEASSFGPLSRQDELGGVWNPLDFVRGIIDRSVKMLNDLRRVGCLHSLH